MSPALTAAALWVVAATVTAFLSRGQQFLPGITLLVLAPVILIWIGLTAGPVWAFVGTLGFLSMFRRPLLYLAGKALRGPARQPQDDHGQRDAAGERKRS